MPAKIPPPHADDLRELYLETLSTHKMGAHYGVTHRTILKWMRIAAIPTRTPQQVLKDRNRARRLTPPPAATLRELYSQNLSVPEIAARFNVCGPTMYSWFEQSGIECRTNSDAGFLRWKDRRHSFDTEAIAAYLAGDSELAIANQFGVSRRVIERMIKRSGIPRRTGSEANKIRFARMTPEERKAMAAKAHSARSYKGVSPKAAEALAILRQSNLQFVGAGENEFRDMLIARGFQPIQQLAFGKYNIDLAIGNIAVEIHASGPHPFAAHYLRTKYLADHGWHCVFVWTTKAQPLTPNAADYCARFIEAFQGKPSAISQYRVIRGSGQLVTEGSFNLDQLAAVPMPEASR